jgi:hypothetical protein
MAISARESLEVTSKSRARQILHLLTYSQGKHENSAGTHEQDARGEFRGNFLLLER